MGHPEVTVEITGDRVRLGNAVPLFSMSDNRLSGFDVAPDDNGFLMLQAPEEPEDSDEDEGIVIVENWFEEFR